MARSKISRFAVQAQVELDRENMEWNPDLAKLAKYEQRLISTAARGDTRETRNRQMHGTPDPSYEYLNEN